MLDKILGTFKTKTALAASGYIVYHLGMFLEKEIPMDVLLDKAWLAVMVIFGRAGISKLGGPTAKGAKK